MYRRILDSLPKSIADLDNRLAQPQIQRKLHIASRMIAPALVTFTFVSVAQAQGTMDFSGAQTLMGTFNARSEGIERSKFWKEAFLTGRCIVPGDTIYEWQEIEKDKKKPKYEITIPGQEPFGMAAVWKLWKNPKTDHWERTFAVLTGEPNELIRPIHARMTTFLEPRDYEEYLALAERPPVHLLRILPAGKMNATLVETTSIGNKQVSLFDSQQ